MTNNHGISCLEGQPIGASSHWKECSYDGEIRGEVTAGDGLGAFGAALILPVQTHFKEDRAVALQWIKAKQSHALAARQAIRARTAFSPK